MNYSHAGNPIKRRKRMNPEDTKTLSSEKEDFIEVVKCIFTDHLEETKTVALFVSMEDATKYRQQKDDEYEKDPTVTFELLRRVSIRLGY
jgi:hypothetical protein